MQKKYIKVHSPQNDDNRLLNGTNPNTTRPTETLIYHSLRQLTNFHIALPFIIQLYLGPARDGFWSGSLWRASFVSELNVCVCVFNSELASSDYSDDDILRHLGFGMDSSDTPPRRRSTDRTELSLADDSMFCCCFSFKSMVRKVGVDAFDPK